MRPRFARRSAFSAVPNGRRQADVVVSDASSSSRSRPRLDSVEGEKKRERRKKSSFRGDFGGEIPPRGSPCNIYSNLFHRGEPRASSLERFATR